MPTTPFKNLVYRLRLPLEAPKAHYGTVHRSGIPLQHEAQLLRLLKKQHVLAPTVLLRDGDNTAMLQCDSEKPDKTLTADSLYRIASITKTVTAAAVAVLCDRGELALDQPVTELVRDLQQLPNLQGVTLRHLLSHTSGLRDTAAFERVLAAGGPVTEVLKDKACRGSEPGEKFHYCNLAFGLLGCILETVTGQDADTALHTLVMDPLGMRGSLFGTRLNRQEIVPLTRILPYRAGQETVITALGSKSVTGPDPLRHFGYAAGSLYTDAPSLSRLLNCIAGGGAPLFSRKMCREMTSVSASYGAESPTLHYGLGLLIVEDPAISASRLIGHQGFAYGAGNGAFYEESTGRQIILLNGGCSEAREGHLGSCNRQLLQWAYREEFPAWN